MAKMHAMCQLQNVEPEKRKAFSDGIALGLPTAKVELNDFLLSVEIDFGEMVKAGQTKDQLLTAMIHARDKAGVAAGQKLQIIVNDYLQL